MTDVPPAAGIEPRIAPTLVTATIPAGQILSSSVNCSNTRPYRLRMPPGWTPGGSDDIVFQCSYDNIVFFDMYERDGTPIRSRVIPRSVVPIERDIGAKVVDTYIRLRAGIAQEADRVFTFVTG